MSSAPHLLIFVAIRTPLIPHCLEQQIGPPINDEERRTFMNTRIACVFLVLILLFQFASADQKGKLPLTTASEKARNHYLQGLNLADTLRIQESAQHFRNAIKEDPQFAIAHLNLSFTEPNTEDFFKDLNQALKFADQASEGERLWILATDAAVKGFPNQQGEYLEKLVAKYPDDERAHHLLGTYYFGLQKYEKAIGEFEKAISINPGFSNSYNMLGYSQRFVEQFDKSEKAFVKYIELIPNDPNPYDSYAELLMRIGRYDESIDNYRKALKIDSHFVNSYTGIATNLNFKGKHASARKELDKLYAIARNDGERRLALFGMTISYLDEGNWKKALEEQEKMLALARKMEDPTNITGDLNTIGTILMENGHAKEAQAKFDEAAKITADSDLSPEVKNVAQQTYRFLSAWASLKLDDVKKARAFADEFGKLAESENNQFRIWQSHQLAGMIALHEKSYDVAIRELEKSNLQDPFNNFRLGLAYQDKGDAANAKKYFERAAGNNGLNNLNLAFIRGKAKQYAKEG